jgi:hypothetical protein
MNLDIIETMRFLCLHGLGTNSQVRDARVGITTGQLIITNAELDLRNPDWYVAFYKAPTIYPDPASDKSSSCPPL